MLTRVDELGRAFAGSQLQIQTYVNRRRVELDDAIRGAFPELQQGLATLEWVSPLEEDRFAEYHDSGFLNRLGLVELGGDLANFWPQGGAHWDGLARIHFRDQPGFGVLLVEAKSYPGEMVGNGCLATEPSLTRIKDSLERTRQWTGAESGNWTGRSYQFANRLSHLYFLREVCGIATWLVNLCFIDDPHCPTRESAWRDALEYPMKALGLANRQIAFYKEVFLPAAGRELFQTTGRKSAAASVAVLPGRSKEWRFVRSDRTGRHQFLGFANARGSCSLRYFDAASGASLGEPRYGRGRNYQDFFSAELAAGVPVDGPPGVSIDYIPPEILKSMRRKVGLDDKIATSASETERASLLSGVDEFIDRTLDVRQIGVTPPHYRHRSSYRHLAQAACVDGLALAQGIYDRIVRNWPGNPCRSDENWRLIPQLFIDPNNTSVEKQLEKAIAENCQGWVNMVPVCSGVMPRNNEGGRRIDLVKQRAAGSFDFIELKVGENCDTPLYAAMEILCYGLIYVFSRRHMDRLGYSKRNTLLAATNVSLIALAPAEAYCYGSLAPLQEQINRGLRQLVGTEDGVRMNFWFESFPVGAVWHREDSPCSFMDSRQKVYSD